MKLRTFCGFVGMLLSVGGIGTVWAQVDYGKTGPWDQRAESGPDAAVPGWFYNLGITGLRAKLVADEPKTLLVKYVIPKSPADGRVQVGDVILGAGGEIFEEPHRNGYGEKVFGADGPIGDLAKVLERCQSPEKKGKLLLTLRRGNKQFDVELDVGTKYGLYSATFPDKCAKSNLILGELLDSLMKNQAKDGSFGDCIENTFATLALLASGESKYRSAIERNAKHHCEVTRTSDLSLINWRYMSAAIVLSEYHLATGEEWVLPDLQKIHDLIAKGQYLRMSQINPKAKTSHPDSYPKGPKDAYGGWGHIPGFEGYGPIAMLTGQGALAYALMQRCGITIDRKNHDAAYDFLRKGTGKNGYVWYGDQIGGGPENWADPGRTGAAGIANFLSPYNEVVYRERAMSHAKIIGLHPQSFPDTHGSPLMGMAYAALAAHLEPDSFRKLMDANRWWFALAQCTDGSFYYQPNRDNSGYGSDSRTSASAVVAFILSMPKHSLIITGRTAKTPLRNTGELPRKQKPEPEAAKPVLQSEGLHGYISFEHEKLPTDRRLTAGMGFYAAVWSLADQPLADFQIGLPSAWIQPDNSDNKDQPLAPKGTLARTWKERGPTWSSVFQTVEGGLGYWAGNHFRYGPPKFSMNATPQCYDYEVGSPGWSFFYSNEALPDNQLGIAQLSNRLLIPPDAMPFQNRPEGEFMGYSWMALPFTESTTDDTPTGDQSWTCFLSTKNFKGPIAFYIPETWSKIGKLFKTPFLHGRGLDARSGVMGGGAMEINTVPRFDGKDKAGVVYSKIPKLRFPVDAKGRAVLVQDVTYYSKSALYDPFKTWRDGGKACSGQFNEKGAWKPRLSTKTTKYDQAGKKITGVEKTFDTRVFDGNVWGLEWFKKDADCIGRFPEYFRHDGQERVAVAEVDVPAETGLQNAKFKLADAGVPYTSPTAGAWAKPGPKAGPFMAELGDGSVVTYSWYRFVDQPSFQQYQWSEDKKKKLQATVEKLHESWTIDRDYMAAPTQGQLVSLDAGLLVMPPKGLETGYVPIVTKQAAKKKPQ